MFTNFQINIGNTASPTHDSLIRNCQNSGVSESQFYNEEMDQSKNDIDVYI